MTREEESVFNVGKTSRDKKTDKEDTDKEDTKQCNKLLLNEKKIQNHLNCNADYSCPGPKRCNYVLLQVKSASQLVNQLNDHL